MKNIYDTITKIFEKTIAEFGLAEKDNRNQKLGRLIWYPTNRTEYEKRRCIGSSFSNHHRSHIESIAEC